MYAFFSLFFVVVVVVVCWVFFVLFVLFFGRGGGGGGGGGGAGACLHVCTDESGRSRVRLESRRSWVRIPHAPVFFRGRVIPVT